jgi:hypothetical protein
VAPAASAEAGPPATTAKRCGVDTSPNALGPTYTRSLSVRGVSCRDGRGFIRRWDRCRRRRGGNDGRCRGVFGFRCRENRDNVIRTQYDSTVRCRRGGDRVIFTYTQFT